MSGGQRDECRVAPPERLSSCERAQFRPPVSGATLSSSARDARTSCRGGLICVVGGGIGGGPVVAKSCCALGCVKSCRSRSRDETWVAVREDVVEVSAVGTGQDLAASEIVQEC